LEGYEKAWGPEHTSTLDTVHNLENLYREQGKMVEAEAMYRRALEGYEKAWGPEHTSTLDAVHNLGNLYSEQGKMVEAEAMYRRALESCGRQCAGLNDGNEISSAKRLLSPSLTRTRLFMSLS